MREKVQKAPWWVWSLIYGVCFGTATTVFNHLQQSRNWTSTMGGGLIYGLVFGAVVGPISARQHR